MRHTLFIDLETYNDTPITYGSFKYAETAEVCLFAYAFNDEPVKVWDLTTGDPMPPDLRGHILNPETILVAHNVMFDRTVLMRYHKAFEDPARWRCTMIAAYMHGLPGALGDLSALFRLPEDKAKMKEGKDLVQLFCKPRPRNQKLRRATRITHPQEWKKYVSYAGNDIEAMRALIKMIPKRNNFEREIGYQIWDRQCNDRGFKIDKELVERALDVIAEEQKRLKQETKDITGGALDSTSRRDAFLQVLLEHYGVKLPDSKAATIERRINDDRLPAAVRELLRNRLQTSSTSVAKYKRLSRTVSHDWRLRGCFQLAGAFRTGRDAGRNFQPQNLPRPTIDEDLIEDGIQAIINRDIDVLFDDVMAVCSSVLRGTIIADEGKKLCVSDLSNIEGRVQARIAGEKWKLKAFADYDAGVGPDLYALAYSKMFNVTPDEVMANKKEGGNWRQIGKTSELAGGFGGGVGSFVTFATAFRLNLNELADAAYDLIPLRILGEAQNFWQWAVETGRTLGLEEKTFVVMDSFKRQWREAHPNIVKIWGQLENAVRAAAWHPGDEFDVNGIKIFRRSTWLFIRLHSGRHLCYPNIRVEDSGQISFIGVNQYTRKIERIKTYGGKLFENCVQGDARDVLFHNVPEIENSGYPVILRIHDEFVTEPVDSDEYSCHELSRIMSTVPPWAEGMPLSAAGFEGYRYRKD